MTKQNSEKYFFEKKVYSNKNYKFLFEVDK